MNINDALRIGADKIRRKDLHITGEHDHVDGISGEQGELLLFNLRFVGGRDRQVMKRDFVKVSQRPRRLMIADDECDVAVKLSPI